MSFLPHKIRLVILQGILGGIFLLIFCQLFYIQVIKSPGIILDAKKRFFGEDVLLRGDVLDRNGNLLALDVITYDIYSNVRDIKKIPEAKIYELASILKTEKNILLEKLKGKIDTKIFSGISEDKSNKIKTLRINFIYLRPKVTRRYPHKELASHIIGFVNNDHIGQHGVEYNYEKLLTKITSNINIASPFPKGTSIVLTIDSILQQFAENELLKSIKAAKAERGTILVLSPKTGEIFAWAVYPTFNPNTFYKEKAIKNWAVTDIYEPGSTFKIITISSGLLTMVINKDSTFFDEGELKIGGRVIKNHHKTKPRHLTLVEVFKQSSNIAAAKIGLLMKSTNFYNAIKKHKMGEKTNIDLPGESQGLLLDHKKWKEIDSATTAIGQGAVSVTPIQIAASVSAFGNNGLWIQPHVLKGIWEPNFKLINENPFQISKEQIIPKEIANHVSSLLRQSVKENIAAMSYIAGNVPGYEVCGKTGTAQKLRLDGKGYWAGHTTASFIGYFPADNPEILTLVIIDDPKIGGGWGNTVAGPLFNSVSAFAAKRILTE